MRASTGSLLMFCLAAGLLCAADPMAAERTEDADPNLWLEEVDAEQALDWVRERNAISTKALESLPEFEPIRSRLLQVYDSQERIPYVARRGPYLYNFWRDAKNVRGLWRRTTPDEYRKAEPQWQTVLDIDALAAEEGENWVWNGAVCVYPDHDRCLLHLSRGGGDTVVIREFDVTARAFVAEGFNLPAAKSRVSWRDRDTLYVGTDFGPGSLTESGYPRMVKSWRRGAALGEATTVFEGAPADVAATGWVVRERDGRREFVTRQLSFFTSETYLQRGTQLVKLDVPEDALVDSFRDWILVTLRKEWSIAGRQYAAGSLLAADWQSFLAGERDFHVLFAPEPRVALAGVTKTREHLILNVLDNVRGRLHALRFEDGTWERRELPAPEFGTVSVAAVDEVESDDYFLITSDFLTPTSLYLGTAGTESRELLKRLPAFFDGQGLQVSQHEAISTDGTRIPYFQVGRKGLENDGRNATLMYGYGGFQLSSLPGYSPGVGLAWLERGGVYVVANIRGGGEFGPDWHQAALQGDRQRAFDDFIAVAQDLVARKVTSPAHLGAIGGSNGGLLTGVMLTQRPDLFGAIVSQVPLLDMRRYHRLLAGASWMAEYGDPDDPQAWEFIRRYSPYHNLEKSRRYPRVLFTTSTRDDRVHPAHARKMAARMLEQGHEVLFYENIEGGHGGAANNRQQAYMNALAYIFLLRELRAPIQR